MWYLRYGCGEHSLQDELIRLWWSKVAGDLTFLQTQYIKNVQRDSHHIWYKHSLRVKDELITMGWSKVKGQGHCDLTVHAMGLLNAPCQDRPEGSPQICSFWLKDEPITIFVVKGQRSRSHILDRNSRIHLLTLVSLLVLHSASLWEVWTACQSSTCNPYQGSEVWITALPTLKCAMMWSLATLKNYLGHSESWILDKMDVLVSSDLTADDFLSSTSLQPAQLFP